MPKIEVNTEKTETMKSTTLRGAARFADLDKRIARGRKKLDKQTNTTDRKTEKKPKATISNRTMKATNNIKLAKPVKTEKPVKQVSANKDENSIKALSIHPMYAAAIAVGDKKEEYRTWQTSYRGDLLICASQYNDGWEFPRGYALCVVNLYDIKWLPDDECFAWQLKDIRPIMPFKYKGKLHLYDVNSKLVKFVNRPADRQLFDWWQFDLEIINAPEKKKR